MIFEKHAVSNNFVQIDTLETLSCEPDRCKSTVGIVVDATGVYMSNNSLDFVTRLRIIDHTFNHKSDLPG
jgi:hypothetical protein